MKRNDATRAGRTAGLSSFLGPERSRLFDGATPERREQLLAAERQRDVFRAWNEVCASTREGQHVTGLKYLPDTNELLVYVEAGSWATEFTMMREIIRARMAVKGVDIAGFIFKTSRAGYVPLSGRGPAKPAKTTPPPIGSSPSAKLSIEEQHSLDVAVAPIEDKRLKEALRNAMEASIEWKKGKIDGK